MEFEQTETCLFVFFCYGLLRLHSSFAIILKSKRKLVTLLMYCFYECSMARPHGAVGRSAVCDCGIS